MIELAPHPAKFSDEILDAFEQIIRQEWEIVRRHKDRDGHLCLIDVFAGTGRIHELMDRLDFLQTFGIELEPEWAGYHKRTRVGNALELPDVWTGHFDIAATSPAYGNRMADNHNATDNSIRITYKHKLGRDPSPDSSAVMHFGQKYLDFHEVAWGEVARVVRPGGLFLCNVSDFIRKGQRVDVVGAHARLIQQVGFTIEREIPIRTKRMGFGANSRTRVENEVVIVARRMK